MSSNIARASRGKQAADIDFHAHWPVDPHLALLQHTEIVPRAFWRASDALLNDLQRAEIGWRDNSAVLDRLARHRISNYDGRMVGVAKDRVATVGHGVAHAAPLDDVAAAHAAVLEGAVCGGPSAEY